MAPFLLWSSSSLVLFVCVLFDIYYFYTSNFDADDFEYAGTVVSVQGTEGVNEFVFLKQPGAGTARAGGLKGIEVFWFVFFKKKGGLQTCSVPSR